MYICVSIYICMNPATWVPCCSADQFYGRYKPGLWLMNILGWQEKGQHVQLKVLCCYQSFTARFARALLLASQLLNYAKQE